jgi:hypothetical protein
MLRPLYQLRPLHQLRRDEYTVGWVCALPVELGAAQEILDEEHRDLERDPADNDENLYALGSISGHNVAICMSARGPDWQQPGGSRGEQMRATFKAIRFGLMVGTGGGVPSAKADIRLWGRGGQPAAPDLWRGGTVRCGEDDA